MPLLRTKKRRLDAERRHTSTNSKRFALRKLDLLSSIGSNSHSAFGIDETLSVKHRQPKRSCIGAIQMPVL